MSTSLYLTPAPSRLVYTPAPTELDPTPEPTTLELSIQRTTLELSSVLIRMGAPPRPREVTGDVTLDDNYSTVLVDATDNDVTVTLPAPDNAPDAGYAVKRIDASSHQVTVVAEDGSLFDSDTSVALGFQFASFGFVPGATQWWVV